MRSGFRRTWGAAAAGVLLLAGVGATIPWAAAEAADMTIVNRASGLPSDWVRALAAGDGGRIWVGTGDRGVALWNPSGGEVKSFADSPGFTSREITSIGRFANKVYVGTALNLMVYDGRTWEALDKAGKVTLRNVTLGPSPDGKEMWAGAATLAGGTVKFDGTRWTFMGGQGRGLFNDIGSFAFDEKGTWMGSLSGTVYLHKGDAGVESISRGLEGNVSSLAKVGDALFAGTNRGLFLLTDGPSWKAVPFPGDWGTVVVHAMSAKGGVLYLGTSAGLVRVEGRRMDRLTEAQGLPDRKVNAVLATGDAVWAGTTKGLAAVRGW